MNFRPDTEDLMNFLKDIPYFGSSENFCLGNSMEEAGQIVSVIMTQAEKEEV
jgi:hypothetical protein